MLPSRGAARMDAAALAEALEQIESRPPRDRSLHTLKSLRQNALGTAQYKRALGLSIDTSIDLEQYEELEFMLRASADASTNPGTEASADAPDLHNQMHVAVLLVHDVKAALELALSTRSLVLFSQLVATDNVQAARLVDAEPNSRLRRLMHRPLRGVATRASAAVKAGTSAQTQLACGEFLGHWFQPDLDRRS